MTTPSVRAGLVPDLAALRRYFWLPAVAVGVAVAAALLVGAVRSDSAEARFRANVVVDALPPLFGPAVLPGPFDYARLATSEEVVGSVATSSELTVEQLKPRLTAEARFNRAEIDFKVTGGSALTVARAWQRVFDDAVRRQTPEIERQLVQPYALQLEQASAQLTQRASDANANPGDPAAQQQLKAAEENFETASRLAQSYEVVASTMKAQPFTVVAPHTQRAGVGSPAGRLSVAVAIGLLTGVLGALLLDYASRRRTASAALAERPPAALSRDDEQRAGSSTR